MTSLVLCKYPVSYVARLAIPFVQQRKLRIRKAILGHPGHPAHLGGFWGYELQFICLGLHGELSNHGGGFLSAL